MKLIQRAEHLPCPPNNSGNPGGYLGTCSSIWLPMFYFISLPLTRRTPFPQFVSYTELIEIDQHYGGLQKSRKIGH